MRKTIQSKPLVFFMIFQLLVMSIGSSQEQVISPCVHAERDANNGVLRDYAMLQEIFVNEDEIDLYAKCYLDATGIDLEIERQREKEAGQKVLFCILAISFIGIIFYQSFSVDFKGWDPA